MTRIQNDQFESEIDLREYIVILVRNWRIIAVAALLAGVSALIMSFFLPPTYEATALVTFTESRYQLQFDPRIESVALGPPGGQMLLAIATSDDILQSVLDDVRSELSLDEANLDEFRETVEAEAPANSPLLELRASADTPELAARIANLWAAHFVTFANNVLSGAASERIFFEEQVVDAKAQLKTAELALIDFESRNVAEMLKLELVSRQLLFETYLENENQFTVLLQNIEGLMDHTKSLPADSSPGLGDDLAAIGLQMQAVNAAPGFPIEIRVPESGSISSRTTNEQAQYLRSLITSVERRLQGLQALIEPLREEILNLQGQIGAIEAEENRFTLDRDLASQVLVSLSNKLEEAGIKAENPQGEVRLASGAGIPSDPSSPRILLITIVASVLGAMLGVFVILAQKWWVPALEPASETGADSNLSPGLATDR